MKKILKLSFFLIIVSIVIFTPTILAYAEDTANTNVVELTDLVLTKNKVTIGIGEKYKIKYISGCNSSTDNTYKSSNKKNAKVTKYGNIIGKKVGKSNITVKNQYGKKAYLTVYVKKPAKEVQLNKNTYSIAIGETVKIIAHSKQGAAYYKYFSSSNSDVASVDQNGTIHAISTGTVNITVKTYNNKKAYCKVKIYQTPTSISFSNENTNILKGSDIHLMHIAFAPNEYTENIEYKSSDNNIATVSGNGRINAKKCGTATITATLYNGVYAKQIINVVKEDNCFKYNKNSTQVSYDYNNVEKIVFGLSSNGENQEAFIITPESGEYDNIFIMTFAIHGFEDSYAKDGIKLVNEGNNLIEYYANHSNKLKDTCVIIVPCLNPDGVLFGKNNKRACKSAFGRCTSKHIDMNRDFASKKFKAVESRNFAKFLKKYNPDMFIDFHGWLNNTYGSSTLCSIFDSSLKLGEQHKGTYFTSSGYLYAYVHSKYNCPAALVEYKGPNSINNTNTIRAINKTIKYYN